MTTTPKNLDEAVGIASGDVPKEEAKQVFGDDFKSAVIEENGVPAEDSIPEWVSWPPQLKVPRGKRVIFMKLRKEWTDAPHLGDRVVIMWPLSVADERLARRRAAGDDEENVNELTKQMIRAIDGETVTWLPTALLSDDARKKFAETNNGAQLPTGKDVSKFFDEIGAKGRTVMTTIYMQAHTLSREETVDFFTNCMHVKLADG